MNAELAELSAALPAHARRLREGGRLAVISFHSLEDRVVKRTLRRLAGQCECNPRLPRCECGARRVVEILTRRPVAASEQELEENPRARSAKLRAIERFA